jgi:hypothetical protein
VTRLGLARAIVLDLLIATALIWIPILVLGAVAAVITRFLG